MKGLKHLNPVLLGMITYGKIIQGKFIPGKNTQEYYPCYHIPMLDYLEKYYRGE